MTRCIDGFGRKTVAGMNGPLPRNYSETALVTREWPTLKGDIPEEMPPIDHTVLSTRDPPRHSPVEIETSCSKLSGAFVNWVNAIRIAHMWRKRHVSDFCRRERRLHRSGDINRGSAARVKVPGFHLGMFAGLCFIWWCFGLAGLEAKSRLSKILF